MIHPLTPFTLLVLQGLGQGPAAAPGPWGPEEYAIYDLVG